MRLGVASQKIAVRVIELPRIENEQELEAAVRFQAQEELPMPLEQAVLDHRVLERINDGDGEPAACACSSSARAATASSTCLRPRAARASAPSSSTSLPSR